MREKGPDQLFIRQVEIYKTYRISELRRVHRLHSLRLASGKPLPNTEFYLKACEEAMKEHPEFKLIKQRLAENKDN